MKSNNTPQPQPVKALLVTLMGATQLIELPAGDTRNAIEFTFRPQMKVISTVNARPPQAARRRFVEAKCRLPEPFPFQRIFTEVP